MLATLCLITMPVLIVLCTAKGQCQDKQYWRQVERLARLLLMRRRLKYSLRAWWAQARRQGGVRLRHCTATPAFIPSEVGECFSLLYSFHAWL